ncbi:MAG: HAMP domain-containing sensor histidine kinase, partial [Candidatus Eremiobacterota bacterium]
GPPTLVRGTAPVGRPGDLELAWKGTGSFAVYPEAGFSMVAPVFDAHNRVVAVVAFERGLALLRDQQRLIRDLVTRLTLAASAAAAVCLLAGMVLGSRLVRPVARLAREVREAGVDVRVSEEGPLELRNLASSLNQATARLRRTLEERRQFLADVSHNLRTPLTSVQGRVDAILDGLVEGEQAREYLLGVQNDAAFMGRLVQRLLDLSRWEHAEPQLRLEEVPVIEPLMEAVGTLDALAEARGVRLAFDLEEPTALLRADRQRLREIFQILLENAVQHAGPEVMVTVRQRRDGERLVLTVEDDGKGYPPEALAVGSFRSESGSLGLGLAIAHRLARAHGWSLELANRESGGAAATLRA